MSIHNIYMFLWKKYDLFVFIPFIQVFGPALVAQLDARPTDDLDATCSTSAESATFSCGDWSWNISPGILSLPLIQDEQLPISGERMRKMLVNRLEE